jgi:hypothetical protein
MLMRSPKLVSLPKIIINRHVFSTKHKRKKKKEVSLLEKQIISKWPKKSFDAPKSIKRQGQVRIETMACNDNGNNKVTAGDAYD